MKKIALNFLIAFLLLTIQQGNAATRKVLFIGNSYIHTNSMPEILRQLALSLGDTLIYDQSTPGGHTLQAHSTNSTTITKIYSQQWDVVVVHEQSQRPAFSPGQVATEVYPYAELPDSLIHDNNTCSETMFMMTWGYKNGDQANCGVYPPVCTYNGMQQRLRESYLEMAQDNNASVAPVGAAWKVARDSFPGIELYSTDNSHPVMAGSYLEACVLYASIFHKAPNLSTYYSTVPAADAINLQNVATHVVLDSLTSWQQHGNYVYAGFDLSISDKTITLQNNSEKATAYAWNFGDLSTSTQAAPPPHTYAQYGQYVVTLNSSNSCFSETKTMNIDVHPLSTANLSGGSDYIRIYSEQQKTTILLDKQIDKLEIYSISGQKVKTIIPGNKKQITLEIVSGIYVCHAYRNDLRQAVKFIVE